MKTITKNQYHQFVGLIALAERHNKAIEDIKAAACAITGEVVEDYGHTNDTVYGSRTADECLKLMGIKVRSSKQRGVEP